MTSPEVLNSPERLYRNAAFAWLTIEDGYQFRKFSLTQDLSYLDDGVVNGLWGNQFYNYPPKAEKYRQEGAGLHMVQYAGKTAATARALRVIALMHVERLSDEASLNSLRQRTLDELEDAFSSVKFAEGDYRDVGDLYESEFGHYINELDRALAYHDAEWVASASMAVMLEGAEYFIDRIRLLDEMTSGELVLPEPGVSSGNISPWTGFNT